MPHKADALEMFNDFDNLPGGKAPRKYGLPLSEAVTQHRSAPFREPTFTKIFRWQPPEPHVSPPDSAEVVGSFDELGLSHSVLRAATDAGYRTPEEVAAWKAR